LSYGPRDCEQRIISLASRSARPDEMPFSWSGGAEMGGSGV